MKRLARKLAVLGISAVSFSAFGDHAVENAQYISRLAYDAADWSESLYYEARRESGCWNCDAVGETEVLAETDGNVGTDDHRAENLQALASSANALHYALSDLYRAARFSDDGNGVDDHRGDRIRQSFERTRYYYQSLRQTWYNLSRYGLSYNLRAYYSRVEGSYQRLSNYVYGDGRDM